MNVLFTVQIILKSLQGLVWVEQQFIIGYVIMV